MSTSYIGTSSICSDLPWKQNHLWLLTLLLAIFLIAVYLMLVLEEGSVSALSWYFYLLFITAPFGCLYLSEIVKKLDQKHEKRGIMMRRLQFETRLGMWSPKETTQMGENASPTA